MLKFVRGLFFFRFHLLTAAFLVAFPTLPQRGPAVALPGAPIEKEGPLSWHLTSAEQESVRSAWRFALASERMARVREWWKGRATPRAASGPADRAASRRCG